MSRHPSIFSTRWFSIRWGKPREFVQYVLIGVAAARVKSCGSRTSMSAHFDLTQTNTNQCLAGHTVLEPTRTRAGFIAEVLIFAIDILPCVSQVRDQTTGTGLLIPPSLASRYPPNAVARCTEKHLFQTIERWAQRNKVSV